MSDRVYLECFLWFLCSFFRKNEFVLAMVLIVSMAIQLVTAQLTFDSKKWYKLSGLSMQNSIFSNRQCVRIILAVMQTSAFMPQHCAANN